jgi:3-methyladenine DNA glycosylase AlkC
MEKLKDTLYAPEIVGEIAKSLTTVYPDFLSEQFLQSVFSDSWEQLELKQRMRHIALCLKQWLPENYHDAIAIMIKASPKVSGLIVMSFADYVELYGQEYWELSMQALEEFTKSCSSEYAIRPFLDLKPQRGMQQMLMWAGHENEHVRRLASEGCRPRLPWAMALKKFKKDPSPIIPILEKLKNDPSEYVRKSVANNLNDISKDHPELVLGLCESWQGKSANTDWIIKHACRTLLKSGNKRAMLLFGFGDPEHVNIPFFEAEVGSTFIGDQIQLSFQMEVNEKQSKKIRLEYLVYFVKANGKTSPKVFQISEKVWKPGKHTIVFKHSFLQRTTRRHFPGTHRFELIINSEKKAETSITLKPAGEISIK